MLNLTCRILRMPFGWGVCLSPTAHPREGSLVHRAQRNMPNPLEMVLCFVTCWLHRQVVSKSHVHKPNTEPATDETPWREPAIWNSRSSEQSPSCPSSHHRPSRTAWSLSRFLSEAWEVERVVPCTRLAPGKNASNISLMWWRLARRLQLSPWESSVVNRLLTPTHAFLARSKSAAALSGDSGKTVKVHLPQWGKVLLSKPLWAAPFASGHISVLPIACFSSTWWDGAGNMSAGVGFMPLALFLCTSILASYLDTRCQADKGCPSLWSGGSRGFCQFLTVTRKSYPFPFLSAFASEQMIKGRNNLRLNTTLWAWG